LLEIGMRAASISFLRVSSVFAIDGNVART